MTQQFVVPGGVSEVTTGGLQRLPTRDEMQFLGPVAVLDTAVFEQMERVATVMARSSLLPDSLTHTGPRDKRERMPFEQVCANAFLVVNQAVRWGMDPFAVAQCVSVVHGKLCYEGKLVAGVLDAKAGIKLSHTFTGEGENLRIFLSDAPFEEGMQLIPGMRPQDRRMVDGSVADWKTTGAGTPWTPRNFRRQLLYRGTREWCRAYEPALLLGVYTEDEMASLQAKDVTPRRPLASRLRKAAQGDTTGFSADFVANTIDGEDEPTEAAADTHPPAEETAGEPQPAATDAPVKGTPTDGPGPTQEVSHVADEDQNHSKNTREAEGANPDASQSDDAPSTAEEILADLGEALATVESVEAAKGVRDSMAERINAAGTATAREAKKIYSKRVHEIAEENKNA